MRAERFPSVLAGALWLLLPCAAIAAPDATARAEIAALMQALSASSRQFQRNGSWHDAQQARAHLLRKYDYLLNKGQVDTTEQFIQRAASRSSLSGKAYRIRCAKLEQDSADWFHGHLREIRSRSAR